MYRVTKGKQGFTLLGLLSAGVLLVAFSDAVRTGAGEGLALCGRVVIPALFPFFCLCQWFTRSGAAATLTRFAAPVFRLVMGRGYAGGAALLMGLVGGYPMGAATLVGLQRQDVLNTRQVTRLSYFLFAPSPAFVITGVGSGLLGSFSAGVILWCACAVASLLTAAVGCRFCPASFPAQRGREPIVQGDAFTDGVEAACETLLSVCAAVVVFAAFGGVVKALPLPETALSLLTGGGEVTAGCAYGSAAGWPLPALAAIIGFGGVCTHWQIKGILKEATPPYRLYLPVRLAQSGLSACLAALLCRGFPGVVQTLAVGGQPVAGQVSVLPSVGLLLTCVVFLSWLNISPKIRKDPNEKQGLCS